MGAEVLDSGAVPGPGLKAEREQRDEILRLRVAARGVLEVEAAHEHRRPRDGGLGACQQRYRCRLEKNATQMPAISWQLTAGGVEGACLELLLARLLEAARRLLLSDPNTTVA